MRIRIGALAAWTGLVALAPGAVAQASIQRTLQWEAGDIGVTTLADGRAVVELPGGVSRSQPGEPDLPWVPVAVPLPDPGLSVRSWAWRPAPAETLREGVVPRPAILDLPYEHGGPMVTEPDPSIYAGTDAWPPESIRFEGIQVRHGRAAALFLVCPFRWDPRSGALTWTPSGRLELEVEAGDETYAVRPLRPSAREAVEVPSPSEEKAGLEGSVLGSYRLRAEAPLRPSLDSPPVEFLIVTTNDLAPAFERLVDWKNRQGYPAAVRTVDWISRNYTHGVDLAERIRLFLKDAYALWGTRTVLLGGDPAFVPVRYARSYFWQGALGGTKIATDYYYACLDGNWNADGDQNWGEGVSSHNRVSDLADLVPELKVGRVSALTPGQVEAWLDKYLAYARSPSAVPGYLNNITVLGEVLFPPGYQPGTPDSDVTNDGATDCLGMADTLRASPFGGFFEFDMLLERWQFWNAQRPGLGARYLDKASTVAAINRGGNILFHMGHGDRDRLAVGGGRYLTSDMMGARSDPKWYGLAYTVNCNSAAVDADCVGEAFQFSPRGGGVNYLGSTNLDFPVTARGYQNYFFRKWGSDAFVTPGAAGMYADSIFAAGQGSGDDARRFLLYSLMFLGDPDLNVWKTVPGAMQVVAPSTFTLGGGPVRVVVRSSGGIPLQGARVCLHKSDDAIAWGETGAGGTVDIPFQPTTLGAYQITVTHPLALPHEASGAVVAPTQSYLTLTDYTLTDDGTLGSRGNGNGRIEAGETVAVNLLYANRGAAVASGVTARLRLASAVPGFEISVADSVEAIGDVPASASGQAAGAFLLEVSPAFAAPPEIPTRGVIELEVIWQTGTRTLVQKIRPEASRADLELIRTTVAELVLNPGGLPDSLPNNNEVIGLVMELYNQGGGTWSHLRGRIVPTVPGSVTMYDSLVSFPDLPPGASAVSDTAKFLVRNQTNLRVNLVVEDTTGATPRTLWSRLLRLRQRPTRPDTLRASSEPRSVSLSWTQPANTSGVWGYRAYRARDLAGPWERVGTGFVEGMRALTDEALPDTARYWYRVSAIDSSGVESRRSPAVFGIPSPKTLAGWPRDIPDTRDACPAIENLNGWGDREVVVLSDVIHAFQADGTDYYDGDRNPATIGRLTPDLPQAQFFLGKPAIADLDGDGEMEIVAAATNGYNGSWNPPAALNVLDPLGRVKWSRTLLNRPVTSAPAVGQLDGDPELEIVLITGKYVWAFNHDGTSLHPQFPDGVLLMIPGGDQPAQEGGFKVDWQLASVALADLDDDGRDEIVFTARSNDSAFDKLYVINGEETIPQISYGTNVPGFPYTYADDTPPPQRTEYSNSSPAVGDFTSRATFNPDGKSDIAILTQGRLWAFDPHADGGTARKKVWHIETTVLWNEAENPLTPSPALGDVDGDGNLDIAVGGYNGALYVVNGRGAPLEGFRRSATEPYLRVSGNNVRMGSPILADIDGVQESNGQRLPEVIVGDSEGNVFALRKGGQMVPGFPFPIAGAKIGIGLNAWDIDRDGYQNLVIQTDKVQAIRVLEFPGCPFDPNDAVANPWPQFRHDARNTGHIVTQIVTPVLTLNLAGESGPGDAVEIRWRCEVAPVWFTVLRSEGVTGEWESLGRWPVEELSTGGGGYLLRDQVPATGEWHYRVEGLDAGGQLLLSGEVTVNVGAPLAFRLHPARPNPFNPRTSIRLDLPSRTICDLRVIDVAGRTVRRLLSGPQRAGTHELEWNGRNDRGLEVGSGVYFVRAEAVGYSEEKQKLVLLK